MTSTPERLPTLERLLVKPGTPFIDRDLSWLQFNERVLAEARDETNPLLQRAKFLSITAINLDEFVMIRMASLSRVASKADDPKEGERLRKAADLICRAVRNFAYRQRHVLRILLPLLDERKIRLRRGDGRDIFEQQILPRLTPPETYERTSLTLLTNLQMAVVFAGKTWFRIPRDMPTVFAEPVTGEGGYTLYLLEDLLFTYLGDFFELRGSAPAVVRLTRDADISFDPAEEDSESIPDAVRRQLPTREQGRPVRLQYGGYVTPELLGEASTTLKLGRLQTVPSYGIIGLGGLWSSLRPVESLGASDPKLDYPPLRRNVPRPLRKGGRIFDLLQKRDLFLHHPYDSFDAYVQWIREAALDPDVVRIEQTVYRIDALSTVIETLKQAAQSKEVSVVIELRARFDELNNLQLADELRKAGVEVHFGFGKLKLHAKIALVTRREEGGERHYTHLSTGNYHAITARQYTDLAILTSHPEIGSDARIFFDSVYKKEVPKGFKQLVPAPDRLHRRILSLIEEETRAAEAKEPARIVAKVNALVDRAIVDALYRAAQAGVKVDLIVRGACSLIPGIKGLSENIRVISIVDRFLEHSRIYFFERSATMYLSSADWMPRNFFSRLELAFPVLDKSIYQYLERVVLPTYLNDNVKAWELSSRGTWKRVKRAPEKEAVRAQFALESAEPDA